jgi:F-type H+-transporting ATPase subunit b
MKPSAKKALIAVAVIYVLTVAGLTHQFTARARPEDPQAAAGVVKQELNQAWESVREADPEHIRPQPISDNEAMQVFRNVLVRKGPIIGLNYTLILQVLNFAVLLLLFYGLAWEPLLKFIDQRRRTVKERLESAAKNQEEAEELREERRRELGDLRAERAGIIEDARRLGEKERDEIIERARQEAERIMEQTHERAAEDVRRARMVLQGEIAELLVRAAQEVLGREIRPEDHDRLIQEAAAELSLEEPEGSA